MTRLRSMPAYEANERAPLHCAARAGDRRSGVGKADDGVRLFPAFAGASLDRASVLRTDERWVAERRRDPQSRAIGVATEAILMAGESAGGPARIEPEVLGASSPAEPVLLGLEHGRALFAVDLEGVAAEEIEKVAPGARLVGVREAGGLLSQSEGGLVAYAAALLNWHRRHPRCAVCGATTRSEEAGHLRRCPGCGAPTIRAPIPW